MSAQLHISYEVESTALCPYHDDAASLYEKWFSDQSLIAAMGDWDFYALPYYDQTPEEYTKRTRRSTWLVCEKDGDRLIPIGYTGLYIQPRHRVGILRLAIAEAKYRGRGHAYRATQLALAWAFDALDMFSVHLSVTASNVGAIRLYEKCGFQVCGRYRASRREPAGRFDEIHMELLQEDWRELKAKQ